MTFYGSRVAPRGASEPKVLAGDLKSSRRALLFRRGRILVEPRQHLALHFISAVEEHAMRSFQHDVPFVLLRRPQHTEHGNLNGEGK